MRARCLHSVRTRSRTARGAREGHGKATAPCFEPHVRAPPRARIRKRCVTPMIAVFSGSGGDRFLTMR